MFFSYFLISLISSFLKNRDLDLEQKVSKWDFGSVFSNKLWYPYPEPIPNVSMSFTFGKYSKTNSIPLWAPEIVVSKVINSP